MLYTKKQVEEAIAENTDPEIATWIELREKILSKVVFLPTSDQQAKLSYIEDIICNNSNKDTTIMEKLGGIVESVEELKNQVVEFNK